MKALHVISGGDSGGAKTHVFALLEALKKYIDVRIVCFTPGVFYQEAELMDIDAVLIKQKNRLDMSIIGKIADMVNSEGFDIVHLHGARANFVSMFLRNKISAPVITTVHSDYKLDFTESLYKKLFFTTANSIALRTVEYYIGVSDNFRQMLIKRGFRPNKIYTVYNGMDYPDDAEIIPKEDFAKKYYFEYEKDAVYVGIIGRFEKVKGIDIFLRGAAEVLKTRPNVRFLIAGDGNDKAELKNLAKSLGIRDKVNFLGFVKDIFSFLNFIDINTLTSLSESFPYVLLEGAALCKPTISSAVGGVPDLIKDNKTGFLFEAKDYCGFAEKLKLLIDSPELRERLGNNLHEVASSNFSGDSLARTHLKIYEDVIANHKKKKEYDVIMSGYYGFKNNGDDALLTAIIKNLKEQDPHISIAVLSRRPKETRLRFGVDSFNRFNPFSAIRAIKKSALLINGGGTLIHDSTSTQSLYYYLAVMNIAKKMGLKVVMYANGFGPIREKNLRIAGRICNKADLITLRDEMSLKELERMKITKPPVEMSADPAITLSSADEEEIEEIFGKFGIKGEKFIGISVRDWNKNESEFVGKIAAIADKAYREHGLVSIFLPMKLADDAAVSRKIAEKMEAPAYIIDREYPAQVMMGIIKKCSLILGMRLHSLIYATAVSVPVIGLVYDPKITGFLKYVSQDRTTAVSSIDVSKVSACIDEITENEAEIKKSLKESTGRLTEMAKKSAELTVKLLSE